MDRRIQVFGPAYLDRVLRIDRPLRDPQIAPPLDQSVDGRWMFGGGDGLTLADPDGREIAVELPHDWPGLTGRVILADPLMRSDVAADIPRRREVRAVSWRDDLGGMGAGFASALGGELIGALGPEDDPTSLAVAALVARHGIEHRPLRLSDHPADWTLLLTSGGFGDKLPVGFRGCHAALSADDLAGCSAARCDVRVAAALPNSLSSRILRLPGAAVRFFAPTLRNMRDRETPVSRFADAIDVLCCNRREWESLADREEVAWRVAVLAITDGPDGSIVRFTTPSGEAGFVEVPAFPRDEPPRDTNRAGEAYAATLLTTLIDGRWDPGLGVVDEDLASRSAVRASAAAALVLDRLDFGFPSDSEIDEALRVGRIAGPTGGAPDALRYNAARREIDHEEGTRP